MPEDSEMGISLIRNEELKAGVITEMTFEVLVDVPFVAVERPIFGSRLKRCASMISYYSDEPDLAELVGQEGEGPDQGGFNFHDRDHDRTIVRLAQVLMEEARYEVPEAGDNDAGIVRPYHV